MIYSSKVVAPIVDVIWFDNFGYKDAVDTLWGGFNWLLTFEWYSMPESENDRRGGVRSMTIRLVNQPVNQLINRFVCAAQLYLCRMYHPTADIVADELAAPASHARAVVQRPTRVLPYSADHLLGHG